MKDYAFSVCCAFASRVSGKVVVNILKVWNILLKTWGKVRQKNFGPSKSNREFLFCLKEGREFQTAESDWRHSHRRCKQFALVFIRILSRGIGYEVSY